MPDRKPEALVEGDVILLSNISYTVGKPPRHWALRWYGALCSSRPQHSASGRLLRHNTDRRRQRVCQCGRVFPPRCTPSISAGRSWLSKCSINRADLVRAERRGRCRSDRRRSCGWENSQKSLSSRPSVPIFPALRFANVGWITALGDARVAKAIRLMHDDVARRWTIDALAREIGMSRSALTMRFSQRVGRAPMDYLTRWRMVPGTASLGERGQRLGRGTCRRLQLAKRLRPRLQACHRTYAKRGIMAMALRTGWKHHMIDAINRWRFGLFVC